MKAKGIIYSDKKKENILFLSKKMFIYHKAHPFIEGMVNVPSCFRKWTVLVLIAEQPAHRLMKDSSLHVKLILPVLEVGLSKNLKSPGCEPN